MKERKLNVNPTSTFRELSPGGIIPDAGNAEDFLTGDWRSMKPIWIEEKCKHCLLCWTVCPDNSVMVKDGKMIGFDYDHCKGCGICTKQCKFGALDYIPEE